MVSCFEVFSEGFAADCYSFSDDELCFSERQCVSLNCIRMVNVFNLHLLPQLFHRVTG